MPHLIDKETGLCVVCQRQDYAAIQEGKKFGRKNYDVRQLALDVITNKDDPHYREILERHYIKQSEFGGNNETQHSHEDHPKIILSEKLPIREKIVANSNFEENEDHIHADPNFIDDLRQPSRNKWRETLRKVKMIFFYFIFLSFLYFFIVNVSSVQKRKPLHDFFSYKLASLL